VGPCTTCAFMFLPISGRPWAARSYGAACIRETFA
jgi:hypothetical protein